MMSPRRQALTKLREILRAIDNGKYFVKRGAINWTTFNFETHLFACALMVDSSDIGRCGPETDEMFGASLSLELATRIPPDDEAEINDEVLEQIYDDVEHTLTQLQAAMDLTSVNSIAFRVGRNTASAIEFHDAQFRVQGIVATFEITF